MSVNPPFEPNREEILELGAAATDWIARHFASLPGLPVVPDATPDATFRLFNDPLPQEGTPWRELFERFERDVVPNSLHIPSPRYFGLMNPAPLPVAIFAEAIAAALNQNLGAWHHSPAATAIEANVIRWLCGLAGYPEGSFGSLTTGGTPANTTALKIALNTMVPEVKEAGLWALPRRPVLYASAEAHFSIDKSANILGLGQRDGMRRVGVDGAGRLDTAELARMITADRAAGLAPFCVVGIAGVTSTGVVDPLDAIAEIAAGEGLWYHVDAAYAAGALLSDKLRGSYRGIERADSITMDPHKWFFMPYPCGAVLTRDGRTAEPAFSAGDVYIPDTGRSIEFRHHGLIGSRSFIALKLWLALQMVGRRAWAEMAERQVELARRFAGELASDGRWEIVTPVDTAIVAARYTGSRAPTSGPGGQGDPLAPLQDAIVAKVMASRRFWISATTTVGVRAIRVMVISYLTRWDHLAELLLELRAAAREVDPSAARS
jgi:glutamate/tyrosine decarboxylase-like PLP-dependent enzyme